jgi:uncharacterized membrane protein
MEARRVDWLKFVHIVTIVAAIGVAEAPILPTLVAARRGDVVGIRSAIAAAELGERVANPLALVSIAFGVATALAGGFDLAASWLVGAYLLLALAILLGLVGGFRHEQRIIAAAAASPDDAPSPELQEALDSRWTGAVLFLPPVLMSTVILLMVVKPTLW